jgi:predicted deacylase
MPDNVPIELSAPDITRWKHSSSGTDYVHVFDSGLAGPQVLVQALTHGNEICGAIALNALLTQLAAGDFRPLCGRLMLTFANVQAFERFDEDDPFGSRCIDEDLNRVWADDELFGARDSLELRRARQLQPFVDVADFVLDIHSMSEPCAPLMVCGRVDKNAAFARAMGQPADLLIDTGHPAGLRMIERGGFGDATSAKKALLIECGQHWERAAAPMALDVLARFLGLTGLAPAGWVAAHTRLPLPAAQRVVRVTEAVVALSTDFHFLLPTPGLGVIEKAGTVIAQDGQRLWLTPYDHAVLVMPGTKNLKAGNTAVRLGRFEAL